ncbi:MAG: translocation/assembly module TamB, partial [Flavobacteriaceae bacterium]|nr:translocation/assembly module TamB [Flavobacteriaceae bacterium]
MPSVQTKLAQKATSYINHKFNVDINIEKIDLSSIGDAKLKNILIKDHHKDTLIYASELFTEIESFKKLLLDGQVRLNSTLLKDVSLQMTTYKGEKDNSLDVFIDRFDDNSDDDEPSDFLLTSTELSLKNGTFLIIDKNDNTTTTFEKIAGKLHRFSIKGSTVTSEIKSLQFTENNRLKINDFSSDFSYSKKEISLQKIDVKTNHKTHLKGTISFMSNNEKYSDFLNKVKVKSFLKGVVSMNDAHLFYKELDPNGRLRLSTNITGKLNDLFLNNISLYNSRENYVKGNFHLKNLFNDNDYSVRLNIKDAIATPLYLKKLLPNLLGKNIPDYLNEIEGISTFGTTQITSNGIKTISSISNESLGELAVNLWLKNISNSKKVTYQGSLNTFNLDVGKLTNTSTLGKITTNLTVKGQGFAKEFVKTTALGKINQLKYNGYNYKNISLNGLIKNKQFDGEMNINDPNLKLDFKGLVDFSKEQYVADFTSKIEHSDLNKLNFFTRDSIATLKGEVALKAKGNSLENVQGSINFKNLSFVNPKDKYVFKDFKITSEFIDSLRVVSMDSPEIISGTIKGKYRVSELGSLTQNAIASIYANFQPIEVSPNQFVNFNFKIYNKVIEILYPDIELAPNTLIKGTMVSDENKFKLSFKSPHIKYLKNKFQKVAIQVDNKNPLFNAQVSIDSVHTGFYDISKFKLVNVTLNDTLFFNSEFKGGKKAKEKYDLSFFHTVSDDDTNDITSVFGMLKSTANIKDRTWFFNEKDDKQNKVTYHRKTGDFVIDSIQISSKNQKISIAGEGGNSAKKVDVNFNNLHLSDILPSIEKLNLKGVVNGKATYAQRDKETRPEADLNIENLEINKVPQGDAKILISAKKSAIYDVDISLKKKEDDPSFTAKGNIDFSGKKSKMDVDLEFLAFDISPFSNLIGDVLQRIRGEAYGTVKLSGKPQSPKMNGDLYLDQAGLYVPILNVDYDFQGTSVITLKDQKFDFIDVQAKDTKKGTLGNLLGTISHKDFDDWHLDLSILTKNMLVLDTEETEGTMYYGTAYLDGVATIKGAVDQLKIDVNGKTKKGTQFVIPLNFTKTAENSDIIRFVDKNKDQNYIQTRWTELSKKMEGLTIDFNIEVTKDATLKMILDKASGSYLEGSGEGNVQVSLDTKDKFDMYGYVVIDKGIYDFKYGIISKPFLVEKGGIIKFNGDPLNAEINLNAIHKVSANPKALLDIATSQRIPVNLITRFSGALFDTQREFDIEFPNLSSSVASELEFKIQNDKTQQFISLLVLHSFFFTGNGGMNNNALIYGTGVADLLGNAFDNILNKQYNNFSLKPTYRVGEKNTVEGVDINDQLGLEFDYKISDRIVANGKFGVPIGNKNKSNIIGEGNIDFLLNDEGTLRLSLFNRQNEIQYTEEEQGYTQGVGINYQIDFDTSRELFEKIGILKKKDTVKNMLNNSLKEAILKKKRNFKP